MIVGSLLLILVAVTLLVFGLAGGSSTMLISSIAASLLAAVALVVGARQATDRPADVADDPLLDARTSHPETVRRPPANPPVVDLDSTAVTPPVDARPTWSGSPAAAEPADRPGRYAPDPVPPAQRTEPDLDPVAEHPVPAVDVLDAPAPDDPADEPAPQRVPPADAAQLARTTIEVLVVDGRPRYHLAGCPHLAGRETEPVPVAEAIDLGFTPCGVCRPVDRLVAAARPV